MPSGLGVGEATYRISCMSMNVIGRSPGCWPDRGTVTALQEVAMSSPMTNAVVRAGDGRAACMPDYIGRRAADLTP